MEAKGKSFFNFFKKHFFVFLIVIISGSLFLQNLSSQELSLDEPETVIMARSVLRYGVPSPWDGNNFTSVANGQDSTVINGIYVWTWHPWLQHYLALLGMLFFGSLPGSARIPFAFFGVAVVVLFYFMVSDIFRNKLTSIILTLQLILLFPLFLFMRQARYYSLSIFFSLAVFYLLFSLYRGKWDKRKSLLFVVCSFLLFFSNYIVWFSSILFFSALALIKKKNLLRLIVPQIILAGIWFLIFKPAGGNILALSPGNVGSSMIKNFSYLNHFIYPFLLLPLLFFHKNKKIILFFLGFILFKIIFYSVFLIPHGRYISDLFPIFIFLFGFVYQLFNDKKMYPVALGLFFILTFTNLFNFPYFQNKFIWWPSYFQRELNGNYPSVIQELAKNLKKEHEDGELVWVSDFELNLYPYSGVPLISPVCDPKTKKLLGPSSVTIPSKIKTFIFLDKAKDYKNLIQKYPCLYSYGEDFDKNYEKQDFNPRGDFYYPNDPDIANRAFPPKKVLPGDIAIFKKK